MDLNVVLFFVLILLPIGFAVLLLGAPDNLRKYLVTAAAVLTAAVGIAMGIRIARGGNIDIYQTSLWSSAAFFIELAIILVILGIAIRIRNWPIGLMAIASTVLAIFERTMSHAKESTEAAFRIDPLAAILVLVVSVIGSVIVFYAIGYMKQHSHHAPPTAAGDGRFFFFLVGFLGVMNGLVMANDLKWLSIFWEATTLCSFVLIGHDGTPEAKRNATRALLINSFGGLALLVAAVLAAHEGADSLTGIMASKSIALIPIALLVLAALTKSAQMPFQSWLLGAMVAPTPVSALLHSATMVKAGSYLVLRLAPSFAEFPKFSMMVAIAGAFTFAMTSALAIGQSNGKKVLAYSTIANLGLIVTCAGINTPLAYAAALMILCFHAASKGLLFLCMGTIEQTIGSRDIEDMGGIMYRMPYTTIITMIGMVSMLVPPFGMLLSKWLAMEAAIESPVVLLLIVVGSAFTVLFWAKWIGRIQTVSYHPKYKMESIPASMAGTMGLLGATVVLAGVASLPLFQKFIVPCATRTYVETFAIFTQNSGPVQLLLRTGSMPIWPIFVILPGLAMLAAYVSFKRFNPVHLRLPFMCGENLQNASMSGPDTYTFRSIADRPEQAWAASYYLRDTFTESRVTLWSNLGAMMILLTMFGVIRAI